MFYLFVHFMHWAEIFLEPYLLLPCTASFPFLFVEKVCLCMHVSKINRKQECTTTRTGSGTQQL